MSGASLAALFQLGPRISAAVLGLPFSQYRPTAGNSPISSATLVGTINAWITADADSNARRPFVYNKPVGFVLCDPALTQVGDYLVGSLTPSGATETFFIASQDVPAPMQVVRCNHTLTFTRPGDQTPGPNFYAGDVAAAETTLATGWPGSIINTGRSEGGEIKLPGDTSLPRSEVLVPALLGTLLKTGDRITDDAGGQYTIGARELTALGWRMLAVAAFS